MVVRAAAEPPRQRRRWRRVAALRGAVGAASALAAGGAAARRGGSRGFAGGGGGGGGPRGGAAPRAGGGGEALDTGGNAAAAVVAWLRAGSRVAAGREAGPAAKAAYHRTLRWLSVPLGVRVVVRRYRKVQWPPPAAPSDGARRPRRVTEADASSAVRALQRLELPFFATSAELAEYPQYPKDGLLIRGNLRGAAATAPAWTPGDAAAVEERLAAELGCRGVGVRLLRRQGQDTSSGPPRFDLYATLEDRAAASGVDASAYLVSLATLVACLLCFYGLPAAGWLPAAGGTAWQGALPVGLLLGLLGVGEGCRAAYARACGVRLAPPLLLPSPQLGMAGFFARAESPPPSRADAVRLALASPLAVAAASCALLAVGALAGDGGAAAFAGAAPPGRVAWPLALLPAGCSAQLWAGTHGLLMASYALLPHSPDGRMALQSLVGPGTASKVSYATLYGHPLLGVLATLCGFGGGWAMLPIMWSFLLINNRPSGDVSLPLEEASEVPAADRAAVCLALALAFIFACPLPLWSLPPA